VTVAVGRDDVVCPWYTTRRRDGTSHVFNVTYAGGLLSVTHDGEGTCVGNCEWTFVLMLECCITSADVAVSTIAGANGSANLRTEEPAESSRTGEPVSETADAGVLTDEPDDNDGPPVGLIVGIVVAVVVVVAVLSLVTCSQPSLSLLRQAKPQAARPLYAQRPAPTDAVYTRIGGAPLLSMRVPARRQAGERQRPVIC